jgi:hypothetical protein
MRRRVSVFDSAPVDQRTYSIELDDTVAIRTDQKKQSLPRVRLRLCRIMYRK